MKRFFIRSVAVVCIVTGLQAQSAPPPAGGTPKPEAPSAPATSSAPARPAPATPAVPAGGVTPPPDYVIGPGDVLLISVWREPDMSAEVVVRPDGKISVPLLNEMAVVGMTPEQLQQKLMADEQRFLKEAVVAVVVKQINSRRVSILGEVAKPNFYPLVTPMNVLQLIATAGGLNEYAKKKDILILRTENGKATTFRFNYDEVSHGKNLKQNIDLKPDDQVIVN